MRKIIFLLLALLLFSALTLTVFASSSTVVRDHGNMLSATELETLENDACNCRFGDLSRYLVTYGNMDAPLPDDVLLRRLGLTWDSDAIVLLVREYNGVYYYDLYTFGRATDMLSDEVVNNILDDPTVYSSLKAGNVYDGYLAINQRWHRAVSDYEQSAKLLAEQKAARAPFMALLFALIFGGIAAGCAVLGVFLFYRRRVHGEIYPLDRYARLNLTDRRDIFMGSFVTRTRVQSSSSSGSGGRSGGGGGHRGGR